MTSEITNENVTSEKPISLDRGQIPRIAGAASQVLAGVSPGWVRALVIMVAIIEAASYFERIRWADQVDGAVAGVNASYTESLNRCQDSLEKALDRR